MGGGALRYCFLRRAWLFLSRRTWLYLSVGLAAILLSASSDSSMPRLTTTEPYPLTYPSYFGNRINITADNPLTVQGVALGRRLFYEKNLSANNSISCGTCHQQQYAFTDGKPFSRGLDGTPTRRNSMSLDNLLWVRHFFWDGRANSMEQQAITPLTDPHEMGQSLEASIQKLRRMPTYPALFDAAFGSDTITAERMIKALTQFERTLVSANAPYDRYLSGTYQPTAAEKRGIALFYSNPDPSKGIRGAGCDHCHAGPRTFNDLYHNNGLDSLPADKGREEITGLLSDRGRFRVVSLRNIALTGPYMHDGRFRTLEEVLDHYSEHIRQSASLSAVLRNNSNEVNGTSLRLTKAEKSDLIAFLHMLTDTSFITNPQFSDPFAEQTSHNKL